MISHPVRADGIGWIEIRSEAGAIVAIAHVLRTADGTMRAELAAERIEGGNTLRSRQSGDVGEALGPHRVASLQFSSAPRAELRISLTLRDDEGVVSQSMIITGSP